MTCSAVFVLSAGVWGSDPPQIRQRNPAGWSLRLPPPSSPIDAGCKLRRALFEHVRALETRHQQVSTGSHPAKRSA